MQIVFLAITPQGLKEAIELSEPHGSAVWCGSDAISEEEFEALDSTHVTRFIYSLQGESVEVIEDALSTIEEHHPGATIWAEQTRARE